MQSTTLHRSQSLNSGCTRQHATFAPINRNASKRSVRLRFKSEPAPAAPATLSRDLVDKCVNTVRFLAVDAVNKAKSGHPGMPMGNAPLGYVLWNEAMRYNPKNPEWLNRDRFVLSNGHGCMLQYALLHLTGYESVQMEDIKQLRQWGSRTPGHPEHLLTPGVEVTTGPLGQGICNAVGLAAAEAHLAARFNKPDAPKIVDHHTFCVLGDGCMMEGMSNEACSLAGHWGLGKLIALYDDNKISIDGSTQLAFSEDVGKRYEALGWHVQTVEDGDQDYDSIRKAIEKAKAVTDKPSLIKVRTTIGYGSPNKAGTGTIHGAALGAEEAAATRKHLNWPYAEFEVPSEVYDVYRQAIDRGAQHEEQWKSDCAAYAAKYPNEWKEFQQLISSELPKGWEEALPTFKPEDQPVATRQASQTVLNALAPVLPGLIGGSADLAPSNLTLMKMFGDFEKGRYAERNLRFGVREHGMAAICNGLALHNSGLIPYCATFFNFTDYMRAAMRMSAIGRAGVIYVTTHDSIGLGEDGTTHQPVEQLTAMRAMPNMLVIRPAGGIETAGAYKVAISNTERRPSTLVLSRQKMATLPGTSIEGVEKGAYVLKDCEGGAPDVILMGTGSELEIAYNAALDLEQAGTKARVVSMPCWELFEEQAQDYKDSVLPPSVSARVSVEAGAGLCWYKYLAGRGKHVGLDEFGSSAPPDILYDKYGITKEHVVAAAKELLGSTK